MLFAFACGALLAEALSWIMSAKAVLAASHAGTLSIGHCCFWSIQAVSRRAASRSRRKHSSLRCGLVKPSADLTTQLSMRSLPSGNSILMCRASALRAIVWLKSPVHGQMSFRTWFVAMATNLLHIFLQKRMQSGLSRSRRACCSSASVGSVCASTLNFVLTHGPVCGKRPFPASQVSMTASS